MPSVPFCFFWWRSLDPRYLSSFPTRRSSDLRWEAHKAQVAKALEADAETTGAPVGEVADSSRSEEHTSELQSRGHLVCRLLLEKKKSCLGAVLSVAGDRCGARNRVRVGASFM